MNISASLDRDLKAIFTSEKARFDLLAIEGGLNPIEDFVGANLRGIYMGGATLRRFNFTGADLRDTFIRLAKVDKTTILCDCRLDIEDELILQARGFLPRTCQGTIEEHNVSLRTQINGLKAECERLTARIDMEPDNAILRYRLGVALASMATFEVRLCFIHDAVRHFSESRRIFSGIADVFGSPEQLEGLLQRLSVQISRYSKMTAEFDDPSA